MEEGNQSIEYWCHQCFRSVETITDSQTITCTLCHHHGFPEEIDSATTVNHHHRHHHHGGDSTISLLAPLLLRILTNSPLRRNRFRQIESIETHDLNLSQRRRRRPAAVLHLLQNIRAGISIDLDYNNNSSNSDPVIFINPFNQTIIGSLGDYLVGSRPQRVAENDPNGYGSPPARKRVMEEMQVVKIETDLIRCSVCLEDFLVGNEVKQMPCKHKFHGDCIRPWLDLHSSCPVCRYRLPSNESKGESSRAVMVNSVNSTLWGFNGLFSSMSGTQIANRGLITSNRLDLIGSDSGSPGQEGGEEHDDN